MPPYWTPLARFLKIPIAYIVDWIAQSRAIAVAFGLIATSTLAAITLQAATAATTNAVACERSRHITLAISFDADAGRSATMAASAAMWAQSVAARNAAEAGHTAAPPNYGPMQCRGTVIAGRLAIGVDCIALQACPKRAQPAI